MKKNHSRPEQVAQWKGKGAHEKDLSKLAHLLKGVSEALNQPSAAVELVVNYYEPILEARFDDFPRRRKDFEQLISIERDRR